MLRRSALDHRGREPRPRVDRHSDGMPAGLPIDSRMLGRDLPRRQHGYGRGRRMQIEHDAAESAAGARRRDARVPPSRCGSRTATCRTGEGEDGRPTPARPSAPHLVAAPRPRRPRRGLSTTAATPVTSSSGPRRGRRPPGGRRARSPACCWPPSAWRSAAAEGPRADRRRPARARLGGDARGGRRVPVARDRPRREAEMVPRVDRAQK